MTYSMEQIKQNITSNRDWAERAIVRLYQEQTASEQSAQQTSEKNGRGFNAMDAEILSSFAEQIMTYRVRRNNNHRLSEKQFGIAFKKLGKYSGQLYRLAYQDNAVTVQAPKQHFSAEASSLGLTLDKNMPSMLLNENQEFYYCGNEMRDGDLISWAYVAESGDTFTVFND